MNKFKKLADTLIKNKFWSSKATLVQLVQGKNENGKVIFVDDNKKELKCVKTSKLEKIEGDKVSKITEFYFSAKSVEDYDLNQKFAIDYNGKRFYVEEVVSQGTMNNEDAIVKFVVKR